MGRRFQVFAAAAFFTFSCKSGELPEPAHPKPAGAEEHAGAPEYREGSLDRFIRPSESKGGPQLLLEPLGMEITMRASLKREGDSYCAYMTGDEDLFRSSADPAFLKLLGDIYWTLKAASYGPKVGGNVIFCGAIPDEAYFNPANRTARVSIIMGIEGGSGSRYMLRREVEMYFKYLSSEILEGIISGKAPPTTGRNVSETPKGIKGGKASPSKGKRNVRLFPFWFTSPNSGIVSETQVPADLEMPPKPSFQNLPKPLFMRKNPPVPRMPQRHMARGIRK